MNRDDIIRLAREAGFDVEVQDIFKYKPQHSFIGIDENIERFVALVAAAEREACALIAESYEPTCESCPSGVANAIRHRGIKDDRDTESN